MLGNGAGGGIPPAGGYPPSPHPVRLDPGSPRSARLDAHSLRSSHAASTPSLSTVRSFACDLLTGPDGRPPTRATGVVLLLPAAEADAKGVAPGRVVELRGPWHRWGNRNQAEEEGEGDGTGGARDGGIVVSPSVKVVG